MTSDMLIPMFSIAERTRRWEKVRALMTDAQLDCLVGFPNQGRFEQLQANTRYLIQIGGFQTEVAVVFPLEGETTAIVQTPRDIDWWSKAQNWVTDLRPSRRRWSDMVVARLKELGATARRVGVIGLKGLVRAPEGVVPWQMFENLRAALPSTEFVDATQLLLAARAVKSAEEIGFIENAERIGEAAVEALLRTARPGVAENVVYAAMVETMISRGGELPTMIYWGAGQGPTGAHLYPSSRKLQPGDQLHNEIEAKWGGYIAQVSAPAVIGAVPAEERALHRAALEIFEGLCSAIRPKVPLRTVGQIYQRMAKDVGLKPTSWPFHGRGLGDDLPVMPSGGTETDAVFEEGNVLILKPGVVAPNGSELAAARAGDTVVVGANGARRLGRRSLDISEIAV